MIFPSKTLISPYYLNVTCLSRNELNDSPLDFLIAGL